MEGRCKAPGTRSHAVVRHDVTRRFLDPCKDQGAAVPSRCNADLLPTSRFRDDFRATFCYTSLMPQNDPKTYRGAQGDRALWSAVVQQAMDDLNEAPFGSTDHATAVAFFIGGGDWRQSRTDIADRIGIHADDLERCGRRLIEARRVAAGIPAVPSQLAPAPAQAAPVPVLVVRQLCKPRIARPVKDRNWWIAKFMAEGSRRSA